MAQSLKRNGSKYRHPRLRQDNDNDDNDRQGAAIMSARKAKEQTAERYLVVSEERSGFSGERYFHLHGKIATRAYKDGGYAYPRGMDDDHAYGNQEPLYSGLRVSCQGDERSQVRADEPVYAFCCEYRDVYSVGVAKARRMAKTLDRIERGLAKLQESRGYVRGFGDYCGRVAEILGCTGIAVERSTAGKYDGQKWDWLSIGDGVNRIAYRIAQWQAEARKPETSSTDTAETETVS